MAAIDNRNITLAGVDISPPAVVDGRDFLIAGASSGGSTLEGMLLNINQNYSYTQNLKFDSFEIANESFGVINHIDASGDSFSVARYGIDDLRLNFDTSSKTTLLGRIRAFVDDLYVDGDFKESYLNSFFGEHRPWTRYQSDQLDSYSSPGETTNVGAGDSAYSYTETAYSALFSTGKVMRNDIRLIEELRTALTRFHKSQRKRLANAKSRLVETEGKFADSHGLLSTHNRTRLKSLGDYQVVRSLVAENWVAVEKAYQTRARILNNHQGLFYTRVRETPLSINPGSPLALRYGSPDDLVPGCPLEDNELPEELEVFMDSVLDIPMIDWQALAPHYKLLPPRRKLQRLLGYRNVRLGHRLNLVQKFSQSVLALRLNRLQNQNVTLTRDYYRKPFETSESLVEYQRNSAKHLSLEDLLSGSPHRLRGYAQTLRNKLDQASHCLLVELRKVTPSIRLDWAEAAELDTLDISNPGRWPGLEKAERQDFNGVRTAIELVQWWFRQLSGDASSTSNSALRNFIRATLMLAASDDPEEILHGNLLTVPGRFTLGEALRVSLNREAQPGTLLQLVDTSNQLIGTLRVDDYDDNGAITSITSLINDSITPATSFTVTGFSLPGKLRI